MFTRAALLSAAVAVLLLSSSCIFGGDDDNGETLPTNTPDAPLNTPTGASGSNGSNGETPGQTATEEPSTPTPSGPQTHTVQAGEFLSTIAPQYGVTVDEIMAANDITDANLIFPGQELLIPEPGATAPTADDAGDGDDDADDDATEEPTADGG